MRTRMMRQKARITNLAAILMLLGAAKACADATNLDDPLLDLFVKKGYVTQQEAEQVEAEARSMQTNGAAYGAPEKSKWRITDGIKSVQLYGDLRMRYENRSASDPADNGIDQQRLRYALRFGLRGSAEDNVYYGLRLETAANPRSPWVTLGTSTSSGVYQGPFGKSTDTLGIGQVYLGWQPADWLNLTIGKLPNLLYTTPMVWDSDLNPEGFIERLSYTVGEADFFANLGQYYYADFNPNNAALGLGINGNFGQHTDDIFLFAWQGGFKYRITPTTWAKIAATLYNYTGVQRNTSSKSPDPYSPYFGGPYIGEGAYYYLKGLGETAAQGDAGYSAGAPGGVAGGIVPGYGSLSYPFNQVGLNDLMVLEIPFELNFRIDGLAARLFGDFGYNLDGVQRAETAASAYKYVQSQLNPLGTPHTFPAQTHDVKAYQIGFGIGSDDLVYGPMQGVVYGTSIHKRDWEFRTYWQHIEQYSLDPNLIDSDFFEGRENMEGVYAAFAYAFTDNFIITVRYGYAQRINSLLGTGGDNQDTPWMNPIEHYHLLQADATLMF